MPPKSNTLQELRTELRLHLMQETGLPGETAHSASMAVVDYLRKNFGGADLYIPKDDDLDARDLELWEAFDGRNYDEVGRRFGLTGRQARNRIALMRDTMFRKHQPGLF